MAARHNAEDRRSADPFEALADPHRRTILQMLHGGERAVQELADELPISRPAVSRHLRVLRGAGMVTDRPEGTRRLYRLDTAGAEAIRAWVDQVWGEGLQRFKLLAENTEPGRGEAS